MGSHYQVAVNFPRLNSTFTYGASEQYEVGDLVEVPLGNRKAMGTVLAESSESDIAKINPKKLKNISGIIENSFRITKEELQLFSWMSKYYHYSLGKLIFDCLPKIMKRPKKPNFIQGLNEDLPFDLSTQQDAIVNEIGEKLHDQFFQHFIHGVTGSGKSAVYLKLMKSVLNSGKSVQFLLPEINLTPQFTNMFSTYLGCRVLTYHSGVTASEKYNIWKALNQDSDPVLIMGVRSSIFLPVKNLGLIVVDEEHDQSFKQTDRCTYNGRDVAIKKAQVHKCNIVLGSATPSMENFYLFEKNENLRAYHTLEERVGEGEFPNLEIFDIKNRFKEKDSAWPLLDETIDRIKEKVEAGEQVLIFINKLGYSSFIQCRNCSHQFYNDNCGCQNNLRYFKQKNLLSCSYCEFKMALPSECPECGGISLMNKGFGTEKVEQVLSEIFPKYCVERFDRDEIKTTKDLTSKLDRFHGGEINILVGTQMLAKGHNFQHVNLVVILGIDSMLNYADFRSTEKTYQLIEQVSGRAGRYAKDSSVIIQSLNPEHSIFKLIQSHSFNQFYRDELPLREICLCPPFGKLAMLYFSSRFRDKLIQESTQVFKNLSEACLKHFPMVRLYGPTPMGIEKKANQFTWAIMFKSADLNQLHQAISTFENNYKTVNNVSYKIDVDPIHIL
jgi:primosomal protein N' (replication factor Y)